MLHQTCAFFAFNTSKQGLALEGRGRSVCPAAGCVCSGGGLGTCRGRVGARAVARLCPGSPGDNSGPGGREHAAFPQNRGVQTASFHFVLFTGGPSVENNSKSLNIPSFYGVLNRFLYFPESHQILSVSCDRHFSM